MKRLINFLKVLWKWFISLFKKKKKKDLVFNSYEEQSDKKQISNGSLPNTSHDFYFDKMIFLAIPMIILWALFDKEKKVKVYRDIPAQEVVIPKKNIKMLKFDSKMIQEKNMNEMRIVQDIQKKKADLTEKKIDVSKSLNVKIVNNSKVKKADEISLEKKDNTFKVFKSAKKNIMVGPKDMLKGRVIKLDEAIDVQKANDEDIVRQRSILKNSKGLMAIDKLMIGILAMPLIGILGINYIGRAFKQVRINNRLSMALGEVDDNSLSLRRINPFMFFSKKKTEKFTNKLQVSNLIGAERLKSGIFRKYGGQRKTNSFKKVINSVNNLENNLNKELYKRQKGKVKVLK